MKRVLFVVNSFSGGGAERVCVRLAKALAEMGYSIDFLTIYKDQDDYSIPDSYRVLCLGFDSSASMPASFLHILKERKRINEFIQGEYDLITSHLPMANVLSALTCQSRRTLYVMHNSIHYVSQALNCKPLLKWFLKGKKLLTVSEGIRGEIIEEYGCSPDLIYTVFNPVDIPSEEVLASYKPVHDRRYILLLGRLEKEKRPLLALEIFAKSGLAESHDLIYLGKGSLQESLEDKVKEYGLEDRVYLMGFQKEIGPWLKGADLLLATSSFEGFGLNLIEALAHHTPVVASDCNFGPSEILIGELSRYLIDPEDKGHSIAVIRDALEHYPDIEDELYRRFEPRRIANNYLEAYRQYFGGDNE